MERGKRSKYKNLGFPNPRQSGDLLEFIVWMWQLTSYIYFFLRMWWLGPIISPKKTLIHTFCTHFFHQVTNISDKKNYTSLNSNYNISRLVEIVKFFQVAKFVKENIIFVEMQYLFVYNVSKYLFCFFFFFKFWKSTFDFYCFAL